MNGRPNDDAPDAVVLAVIIAAAAAGVVVLVVMIWLLVTGDMRFFVLLAVLAAGGLAVFAGLWRSKPGTGRREGQAPRRLRAGTKGAGAG